MSLDLPEREIEDFYFKALTSVQIFSTPNDQRTQRLNLLATSNKFGLTFGAWLTDEDSSEVKVFKTVELRQQAASDGGDGKVSDNLPVWSAMPITGRVVHIGLSSDQLSLSVTVERDGCIFANIVDVRGFALKGNVPQPFVSVRLGTANGVQLLDMCWNPGANYPSLFAACLNDGSVALLEVTDTLKIVASLPPDTHASCLCWSPKGKQLVVGKVNGSFTNYDQALKVKKEIPTPTVLTDGNTLLCDILWQSTFVYVCVYNVADAPRDPPTFLVVSTPKNAPVTYQKSSDICYGSGDSRDHKFYMHQSKQKTGWCMITASSTNAMETAIVGKKEDDKTTGNKCEWELWSLNDNGRAETPMTASYEETMPIGTAIDYTATDVIRLDEEKTHPASPVYMMLTTHGMLVMFHMIYKDAATSSNAADLMAAVCDIPNTGARMPKKSSFTTSTPAKAQPQTETSSSFGQQSAIKPTDQQPTPITSTGTSLFATKPTAQSGSTSQPFTFNSSATSTPAFSFNKPVTLQPVTQTPTTTPSFSFASAISTSSVTKPTTTLAAATAATIAPAAAATTTPAATAFGGFGAATSVPGTLVAQPSAARGNAVAAAPVPGTATNPPAASSPASATQPIAKPSPQIPSSPRHTPQPQAVIAGHHTPPAVGGTLTKPQTQPTPPTKQLSTSEVHTDVKDTDHFYMDSICNEMKLFQKEINDLRTHCSSSHNTDIGSEDEMIYLQTNTNELQAFSTEIKKLTESQNMEIVKLKSEHLDAFSMVDECQRRHDQHNVSGGQKNGHIAGVKSSRALQQKALDPASMKRLKDIRAQYRYVEATIRDVDMQLDARWELHHKKTKKANYKPTPATDHIYDTLSANQKVIINQLTFIEQLRQEMSKIKLQKTTPTAHSKISDDAVTSGSPNASFGSRIFGDKSPHTAGASRTNTPSHLSYNSSARSGTSPSAAGGSPAPAAHFGHQQSPTITVSPEKQAKLRDHLSRRTITPVKSTIPANLSISKLSSGESFRHRLSEEMNQTAQSSPSKSTIGTPAAITSPSKLALQQPTPTNQNSSSMAASRSIAGSNSAASVAGMKVPTLPAMALTGNTLGSRASAQPSSSSTAVATTSITTPTSAASTTQAGFFFKPTSSSSKSPSKAESTTSPGSGLLQQNPSAPQSGFSFGSSSSGVSFSSFDASASTAGLFPARTTTSSMASSIPSVTSTTSSTSSAFLVPSSASGSTGSQSFTVPSSKPVTSGFSFTNKANEVSGFGTPAAITGSLAPVSTTSTALFGATAAQSTQQLSFTDVSSTTLPTFKPADKVDAQDTQDVDSTTGTPGSVFGGGGNSSLFGSAGSGGTSAASSFSFTASSTTVSSSVTSGATAKFTFDSSSSSTATSASPSPVLGQKAGGLFGTNSTFSGFGGSSGSTSKQETTLPLSTSLTSAATTSITTPANTAQANAADSPASPTPSPRASPPIQPVTPVKSSSAPVPTLTTSDASPAQSTPSLSIFGNAASINGSSQPSAAVSPTVPDTTAPPKTTSSLFGNLLSSTTVSSAPVFGGNASASFSGFGSIAASGSSVFGSASTTSASFTFNTSSSTTASTTGSAATTATAATTTATAATTTATAATTTATSSTTATTTPSLFGLTTSPGPSVFGSSVVTSSSASGGGTSLFGASAVTTSTSSASGSSLFGSGTVATSTSSGGGSSSLFGSSTIPASTSSSGGSSLFGGATTTSSSLFATTSTSTTTGQTGGLFGSAGSGGSSSVFGGTAPPSTSSSIGSTSGGGLFGSAAGASSGGAGGTSLFGGSALFGTQTTSATAPSLFGTTSVSASAAPATETPAGTSGGLFGSGGGVFGGLGGTPSAENANKNVFGATTFGTSSQQNTGLFGSGGATSFSSPAKSQASTFGGGFNAPASGGFGGFQSSSTPTGSAGAGGFGSPPAFGGAPSFGGGGTGFGSKATFSSPLGGAGGSSATAGSIFGQGAAAATGAGFASFADSNTSTFGALSQGAPQGSIFGSGGGSTAQPTGFGELSQQGTSGGIFGGSAAATSPGFGAGAGAGGGGGFGGNASFGSPQQGSAFTSHRG